jgi:hypothetical protein
MRRLQFALALSKRHHDSRPFVIRHGKPSRDLITRPVTTGANLAVQPANVDAW